MNKFISIITAVSLFSSVSFADCDFSTGATKNSDGTYTYTKDCHVKVGELKQDNDVKGQQIQDLNKAIDLKNQALTTSDQRTQLWMDTSFKLESNMEKMDAIKKNNEWVYFGLGILTTFAAASLARSMTSH